MASAAAQRRDAFERAPEVDPRVIIARFAPAVVALLLSAGCSAPSDTPETTASEPTQASGASHSSASPPPVADAHPCELLTNDELAALTGKAVGDARRGETAGAPNCQWPVGEGRVLQVISASASDWATALPDVIRQVEASGLLAGSAQEQTLKDAAALVEGGGRLEADKACDLFSQLLELRGEPPDTERTVNVFPSEDDAQGVAGQVCSEGRFTSVSILDPGGLIEPLPVEEVGQSLDQVHRRAVG